MRFAGVPPGDVARVTRRGYTCPSARPGLRAAARNRSWSRVPKEPSEGSLVKELAPLLWIVAIAVIFWLLIIRPAQRRQKDIAQVQASIAPGETVVLTSGIFGTVSEIDDATLVVEIAPGVNIKVARGAVGSVVRPDEPADSTDDGQVGRRRRPTPPTSTTRSADVATRRHRPGRTLIVFFLGVAVMYGLVALAGTWKPALGLDLQGGLRITLTAEGEPDRRGLRGGAPDHRPARQREGRRRGRGHRAVRQVHRRRDPGLHREPTRDRGAGPATGPAPVPARRLRRGCSGPVHHRRPAARSCAARARRGGDRQARRQEDRQERPDRHRQPD